MVEQQRHKTSILGILSGSPSFRQPGDPSYMFREAIPLLVMLVNGAKAVITSTFTTEVYNIVTNTFLDTYFTLPSSRLLLLSALIICRMFAKIMRVTVYIIQSSVALDQTRRSIRQIRKLLSESLSLNLSRDTEGRDIIIISK